jgi:hypothetical protein
MLSCDPRLALCTLVQLVCPALPCPFVSVVSFEGARVNSFGLVRARARPGGRARIKNAKFDPRLALCTLVQPFARLSLASFRSFGRVV